MGSIILFKKFDPKLFLKGKEATCRKIGWKQAGNTSVDCQLRVNFDLPPFAIADVKSKRQIDLIDLDESELNQLSVANLEEYYMRYGKSETGKREFIQFSNIRINEEFPWDDFMDVEIPMVNVNLSIKEETANKIRNVGKSSKYRINNADRKNGYVCRIPIENGEWIEVPFKAMFFIETNEKLGKIISISADSASDCISEQMGLCQLPDNVKCYGKSAECQYCRNDIINCEESNKISGLILRFCNASKMAEYISKRFPYRLIRFNKHGDFIDVKQLLTFMDICKRLEIFHPSSQIKWYGYTARDDLMTAFRLDSNFWMSESSIWLNGSNEMYTNRFKGVWEYSGDNPKCMGDCGKCGNCYKLRGRIIEVKFHGNINSH